MAEWWVPLAERKTEEIEQGGKKRCDWDFKHGALGSGSGARVKLTQKYRHGVKTGRGTFYIEGLRDRKKMSLREKGYTKVKQ